VPLNLTICILYPNPILMYSYTDTLPKFKRESILNVKFDMFVGRRNFELLSLQFDASNFMFRPSIPSDK